VKKYDWLIIVIALSFGGICGFLAISGNFYGRVIITILSVSFIACLAFIIGDVRSRIKKLAHDIAWLEQEIGKIEQQMEKNQNAQKLKGGA